LKINPATLRKFISSGKIARWYLFEGPEQSEMDSLVDLISEILDKSGELEKQIYHIDGDFDGASLPDVLSSGSLFAGKTLVIVKNVARLSSRVFKRLSDWAAGGSGDGTLILVNQSQDKVSPSWKKALGDGYCYFYEMWADQREKWIQSELSRAGFEIDREALLLIQEMVSGDRIQLESILSRIVYFYDDFLEHTERRITATVLEQYLVHSREETVFSLFSAAIAGEISEALDIGRMLYQQQSESLCAGLAWCLRRLLVMVEQVKSGTRVQEVLRVNRVFERSQQSLYSSAIDNYSESQLIRLFVRLACLERDMRLLPDEPALIALELFICQLARGNAQESFAQGPLQSLLPV
jgi:DNA polymerase-3 subunit delta